MNFACTYSRALVGVSAPLVTIESHIASGLQKFSIVGLAETAVKESKDRVRGAILNAGFAFSTSLRITVNLAPADLPKETSRFDLPIAMSLLAAMHAIPAKQLIPYEFIGELGLSGEIRPIKGVLPACLAVAKQQRALFIPKDNAEEAAYADGCEIYPVQHLLDIVGHLSGQAPLTPLRTVTPSFSAHTQPDYADIQGQEMAKRALEIAACGKHSVLMVGPPGAGKTLLARTLPSLLPEPLDNEKIDIVSLHLLQPQQHGFESKIPFRAPHHSASTVAVIGGGNPLMPGEITLAHNGVLFLDELPEFNRKTLEALREPLETKAVNIARANYRQTFPADFQLIAAMNPCPCGYYNAQDHYCRCTPEQISRYLNKISGPMLDRFDCIIEILPVDPYLLSKTKHSSVTSNDIRKQVQTVRARQYARQRCLNTALTQHQITQHCTLSEADDRAFAKLATQKKLSSRVILKIFKIARTIADLDNRECISRDDILQAVALRSGIGYF